MLKRGCVSNEQDFVPHTYHKCLYFWIENLQAKTWKLGYFYMEKSYPEKEGHPPSPVNFRDRLYEKKVVPAKQPLTIALAHAMIVSPWPRR